MSTAGEGGGGGGGLVALRDGARLFVKELGDGDRSKQLVIALHGSPGVSDHREPESAFGFLTSRYRVLVYDARGSGRSDLKGPYTHHRWTADIDELRIRAGSEPIILAGAAYGGFVALEYAIKYPSYVSALILRDTWASGPKGTMYALKASLTCPDLEVDPDRQYRAWTGTLHSNDDLRAALREILPACPLVQADGEDGKLQLHYETHNFAMSYNQPRFDVRPSIREVYMPTLILAGRRHPTIPVQFSDEMHRLMPNSQLTVFEDAGRLDLPAEEPVAFQERVHKFLEHFRL
ncbi:hypothetical protein QQS21_006133 [Conoideocrella luteorostrata]|uniref:AB hydrolase-1 domain-containing protein n=1 Tax=Conoideocrella luteorostrata TaxID=1105319 RepID=A0AAJ0FYJ2_9HYPO|nr:hypothetical protein QQS21_006133 [Conoideocrella luteorostrata]